jgi:hypothetical protein
MEAWEVHKKAGREAWRTFQAKVTRCRCGSTATLWPRDAHMEPHRVTCDGTPPELRSDEDARPCWAGPETWEGPGEAVALWNSLMRLRRT